jgi:hypothetical protein
MILQCETWENLLGRLQGCPQCKFLQNVSYGAAAAVLAAPVALAWWIANRAPHLAQQDKLRILVIGAETVDAPDQGRWYALLSVLLGSDARIETTLVGDSLDVAFSSSLARYAPADAARCVRSPFADFVREENVSPFDLAVIFHPGMQKNRGWLEDGSLAKMIASGAAVIASAYEEDEFEVDRFVIEAHGYCAEGDALINPFFLDLSDVQTTIRWGRVLWRFEKRVPAIPGMQPDRARLAGLDTLTRMVMHSMITVGAASFAPGARVSFRSSTGASLSLIHIFDNYFVDPATRRMQRLGPAGEFQASGELSAAEMAAYPEATPRDIERAIWAARIKVERLMPYYPEAREPDSGPARAQSMLSGLRSRAAKLFEGKQ